MHEFRFQLKNCIDKIICWYSILDAKILSSENLMQIQLYTLSIDFTFWGCDINCIGWAQSACKWYRTQNAWLFFRCGFNINLQKFTNILICFPPSNLVVDCPNSDKNRVPGSRFHSDSQPWLRKATVVKVSQSDAKALYGSSGVPLQSRHICK